MTLTELYESVEQDSRICDMTTKKIGIYLDALFRENEINCEEAELKVMKESGNIDDLTYLIEEANDGLIKKAADGIKKIFDTVIEFIKNLAKKVSEFFTGKSVDDTTKKMEEAIKKNPKLGKEKVTIPDIEGNQKFFDKQIAKLDKLFAKVKGGHVSKNVTDEVDEINAEIAKRKKAAAIGAGVTVTLAAAIAALRAYYKKGSKLYVDDLHEDTDASVKFFTYMKNQVVDPVQSAATTAIAKARAAASKVKVIHKTDSVKALWSVITGAFSGLFRKKKGKGGSSPTVDVGPDAFEDAAAGVVVADESGNSILDDSYLDSILETTSYDHDDNSIDSIFDSIVENVNSDHCYDDDDETFGLIKSIEALF